MAQTGYEDWWGGSGKQPRDPWGTGQGATPGVWDVQSMPWGTGAGTGPGGSTPYIGGPGDPNFGRGTYPAGTPGSTPSATPSGTPGQYGDYLGWNTAKLNDPNKHDSKYDFLRIMMDAGIDPSSFKEKDPAGINAIVAALNARGIGARAVPGSDDRLFWPGEGEFDAIDRTTTPGTPRFFFAQQTDVNGQPLNPQAPQGAGTPQGPAGPQGQAPQGFGQYWGAGPNGGMYASSYQQQQPQQAGLSALLNPRQFYQQNGASLPTSYLDPRMFGGTPIPGVHY